MFDGEDTPVFKDSIAAVVSMCGGRGDATSAGRGEAIDAVGIGDP
jgi:hypothetical protein